MTAASSTARSAARWVGRTSQNTAAERTSWSAAPTTVSQPRSMAALTRRSSPSSTLPGNQSPWTSVTRAAPRAGRRRGSGTGASSSSSTPRAGGPARAAGPGGRPTGRPTGSRAAPRRCRARRSPRPTRGRADARRRPPRRRRRSGPAPGRRLEHREQGVEGSPRESALDRPADVAVSCTSSTWGRARARPRSRSS